MKDQWPTNHGMKIAEPLQSNNMSLNQHGRCYQKGAALFWIQQRAGYFKQERGTSPSFKIYLFILYMKFGGGDTLSRFSFTRVGVKKGVN